LDSSNHTVRVGGFDFDLQSGELRRNGEKTHLPEQPFKILQLLVARRGEVIAREELRLQLWPADTFVDFDRGLNSAMKKLRDALGDSAEDPTYVETIPRRGYRLIAPVREDESVASKRNRRALWIVVVVVVVAVFLIAAVRFHTSAARQIRSIAVLPLANLSGDPGQEYFADGMTEALITDVAQLKEVRVISRTSVMPYKQSKKSLPEIARQLNVDGVIEGGVVRSGGRVRVTVQLINAATDQHLWAQSYERDFSDVVSLQGDLSSAISHALHAQLTHSGHAPRRVHPAAYDFFLRGTAALGKENAEGVREAITFFQRAVAIQSDFAPGYASLADAYSQHAFSGAVAPREWMTQAKQAALKAIALDPELAQGHTELGLVFYRYDWNWKASEEEFRRAVSLNPSDASAHGAYASVLRLMGRIPEADAERRRWHGLNPYVARRAEGFLGTGGRYRAAGDYPKAIAEMHTAVQMDPSLPRGHFQLGWTLGEARQLPEAIAELERAVQLSPNNTRFRGRLGWAYALAGQNEKARAILADLEKRSAHAFVSPVGIALVHIGLRENQPALDLLERAYRERDFDLIGLMNSRTFTPLRSEPRFQQLVRKIGLPGA
jgi:TolB-like protein/DNA-binding winged helix-turn-helix (wHTH) protein/Tfp pilus assembly protein PilF